MYNNRDNVIKAFENGVFPFEESASQEKQVAKDLKVQTPNQMFSRLPIFLAQLKAGNISKKFRGLLYSLYRSKKITKQLCKSLIHIIWKWKQFLWTAEIIKQVNHTDLDWI